ncbi:MAG: hypothetical protein QNJ33_09575 [Crocosphaera sp.]|nr:hypothetical protein [Crocosphaera sp.]
MKKIIAFIFVFMALILFSSCSVNAETLPTSIIEASISNKDQHRLIELPTEIIEHQYLEGLAADLSSFLADKEFRRFVSAQIKASPKTNTIVLREALATALRQGLMESDNRLFRLQANVQQVETIMEDSAIPIPKINLMVPVLAHRELLESSEDLYEDLYVAIDPLTDESEVKSITAFSNGKHLSLSANKPPKIPTIVITFPETKSLDPEYPLTILEELEDEAKKGQIVDDFVGLPNILITNDNEPWYRGSPEIEVRFRRWLTEPGVFQDTQVELKGVNDENQWYSLGDPNDTYQFLDNRYQSLIEIAVWELDSPDSDDFVGLFIPNWRSLPFGGYTDGTPLGAIRDARIRLDRD